MSTRSLTNIAVGVTLKATLNNLIDGATSPNIEFAGGIAYTAAALSDGNGANKANRWWQSTDRTLTSGNSESLNLYSFTGLDIGAGAGKDPVGQVYANTKIVCVLIICKPSSVGKMVIGNVGGVNAWLGPQAANNDPLTFSPGGICFFFDPSAAGFSVGSANNNLLKIAASAGAITYSIYVLPAE